ncbi:MAG: HlyD family efflux transporter periplasmic adaptor subunit [Armatimonadetes bacterium]|nr:HlyD family efflux transporter periplasmic adaptor subunit [Armatimonadota bacterium]
MRLWLLILALLFGGCSQPVGVKAIHPRFADIEEGFEEPAETRLDKVYPVNMPVAGRVGRIELEPGDLVRAGEIVAIIDRLSLEKDVSRAASRVDEVTARLQLQQDVGVERSAEHEARAAMETLRRRLDPLRSRVDTSRARLEQARTDQERAERLYRGGYIPQQEVENARLAAREAALSLGSAQAEFKAQQSEVAAAAVRVETAAEQTARRRSETPVLEQQLQEARAALEQAQHIADQAVVLSPITGTVLERAVQGPQEVAAGTTLLQIGNVDRMEVEAEVLTGDALKLKPGTPVVYALGGDRPPLLGKVARIEPAGFTKRSSLGVEQQRVRVLSSLVNPPPHIGVGYRLQARYITARRSNVLVIPRFSALQAPDGSFYVYKVVQGALARQPVQLGLRSDLLLQVLEGLSPEDLIVEAPDPGLQEADIVQARE